MAKGGRLFSDVQNALSLHADISIDDQQFRDTVKQLPAVFKQAADQIAASSGQLEKATAQLVKMAEAMEKVSAATNKMSSASSRANSRVAGGSRGGGTSIPGISGGGSLAGATGSGSFGLGGFGQSLTTDFATQKAAIAAVASAQKQADDQALRDTKARIKAMDDLDAAMNKVAAQAARDNKAAIKAANDLDKALNKGKNDALKQQTRDAKELEKALKAVEKHWDKVHQAGARIQAVGSVLTIGLTAPLVGLAGAAIKANIDMEGLRRAVGSVAGSSAEAAAQLVRLREIAKLPGLTFPQAVQASVNLQAVGYSAELAEKTVKSMGNALAQVGRGSAELEMVVRALTQIEGKGKVSAQEINQLAEHLPQIRRMMRDAFGTANTESIQAMGMMPKEFVTRLTEAFSKIPALKPMLREKLEELQDTVFIALDRIGASLTPLAGPAISQLNIQIDSVSRAFAAWPDWLKGVAVALGIFFAGFGPGLIVTGSLIRAWVDVRKAGDAIKTVLTASRIAQDLHNAAVVRAAAVQAVATGATAKTTIALGLQTPVVNILAAAWVRLGLAMAPVIGFLSGVGIAVGLILAVLGSAAAAAEQLAKAWERMHGGIKDTQTNFGDAVQQIWHNEKPEDSIRRSQNEVNSPEETDRLTKEARARFKENYGAEFGDNATPGSVAKQKAKEARQAAELAATATRKESRDVEEAKQKYYEEVQRGMDMGAKGEDTKYQRKTSMIPTLQKRIEEQNKFLAETTAQMAAIDAKAKVFGKNQEHYDGLVKDTWQTKLTIAQTENEITQIRLDAQKEVADNAKKARENAFKEIEFVKDQRAMSSDIRGTNRKIWVMQHHTDDDKINTAMDSRAQIEELQGKRVELLANLSDLRAMGFENNEDIKRLQTAEKELADNDLAQAAEWLKIYQAQKEHAKATQKQIIENIRSFKDYNEARADAQVEALEEDKQAAASLFIKVPIIRANQRLSVMQFEESKKTWADFYKMKKEIFDGEEAISKLINDATKSEKNAAEKAITNAKKLKNDQEQIFEARIRLIEAKSKNDPFSTDEARNTKLIQQLLPYYKTLLQPSPGETELDSLQRQLSAEDVKSRILQAMGLGKDGKALARTIGHGHFLMNSISGSFAGALSALNEIESQPIALPSPRDKNFGIPSDEDIMKLGQSVTNNAIVIQVVSDPIQTRQDFYRRVAEAAEEASRQMFPGVVGYTE